MDFDQNFLRRYIEDRLDSKVVLLMKMYQLDDVFGTSRDIPLTYVSREAVDDELNDLVRRKKHVIVYGGSKQGKTCLRKKNINEEKIIIVQCQNTWDLRKLNEAILKKAGFRVEVSNSKTVAGETKANLSLRAGFKFFGTGGEAEGGLSDATSNSNEVTTAPLEIDLTDPNDLVEALKAIQFDKIICLEDFHYLPPETQETFAFALKTIHETSDYLFLIVAVWREENRLILYNGDLENRVIAIDADEWSLSDLEKIVKDGEKLLNIRFDADFMQEVRNLCLGSVYILQEVCYRLCRSASVFETSAEEVNIKSDSKTAEEAVIEVVNQQSGRYKAFLSSFSAGLQGKTELEMWKWILYPIIKSSMDQLEDGLSYKSIRSCLEGVHPRGADLNPGNITQVLKSISNLQTKKNIKPFIFDYDSNNKMLYVVDRGFLIWLSLQDREEVLEDLELPSRA